MTEENKKVFNEEVDSLLKIFNESGCVEGSKKFNLEKVKNCIESMIDFSVKDETEKTNLKLYLVKTDFFTSPASTKFHGDWESGLCVHTLMVAVQALRFSKSIMENYLVSPVSVTNGEAFEFTASDVFLSALCHDFCKVNSYKIEFRNTKDINGNWTKKPFYKTKSEVRNLGHGNESVLIMLELLPSLFKKRNVIEAVSRHMGFSDLSDLEKINYSNFLGNPLVLLLQLADQSAAAWWDC